MEDLEIIISDSCECKEFHWVIMHYTNGKNAGWANTGKCGVEPTLIGASLKAIEAYNLI